MVRPWNEWIGAFVHMGEAVANLSHAEIISEIRRLIEDDTVDIKIKGVYPWRINHVVAERYHEGRVFCAGDAVHRHPPTNALGGNTCIQDAFNLVWKLAAVLRWGAGPQLLDSFNSERQPIGKQIVDRAIASLRLNPEIVRAFGIERDATPTERQAAFEVFFEESDAGEARRAAVWRAIRAREYNVHAHGVEMNQVYTSPTILNDGEPPLTADFDRELHYHATTYPGARLPHCWVEHDGETCSTLDLAKPERFTLLARNRGGAWLEAAAALAAELPFELAALRIGPGCEVSDLYGEWADVSEIGETGAMLVRPDQHIAWRCKASAGNERAVLQQVIARCLGGWIRKA
jgi:2,4-dichlorophenol 6-monooxygenase